MPTYSNDRVQVRVNKESEEVTWTISGMEKEKIIELDDAINEAIDDIMGDHWGA